MDAATVAPYVAAGVALAVGILTPWRSNRAAAKRQREQLKDAAERQRAQLDDATKRQREQLEHDRAMRRREEIIAVIGDATAAGSRRFYVADRAADAWRDGLGWEHPRAQELESERIAAVEEVRAAWGRVQIRVARDSSVRERFDEWRDVVDQYSDTVRKGLKDGVAYMPETRQVRQEATQAADRWLEAARDAVAALDRGEPGPER